jgi:hypothetical protein
MLRVSSWRVLACTLAMIGVGCGTIEGDADVANTQDDLEGCASADPDSVLVNVSGDFELTVDPNDGASNLIYISNVAWGASSVVAARVNGKTGRVVAGTLTTIAGNFKEDSVINGPEFIQKSTGELGVMYKGLGGVHAVFRKAEPAAWNAFQFDVSGNPATANPPVLPTTSAGDIPGYGMPLQDTYMQFTDSLYTRPRGRNGHYRTPLFGPLDWGTPTNVAEVLHGYGLNLEVAAQSTRDGYFFFGACDASGACALCEAAWDGEGGFYPGSFQRLASLAGAAPTGLVAATHPVTGTTVVFSNDSSGGLINVWEQPAQGCALKRIGRVSAPAGTVHFRAQADQSRVVLHFLVRKGTLKGSYTVAVSARGSTLVAGPAKQISTAASGSELVWLPAINQWAIFKRVSGNALKRCWVNP